MEPEQSGAHSWERPWTVDEMRQKADTWSLAGDAGLLKHINDFSQRMIARVHETNRQLDDVVQQTKVTAIRVDNAFNDFIMLANTQFVENRVFDEEVTQEEEEDKKEAPQENREEALMTRMKDAIHHGLEVVDDMFEIVHVDIGADSDSEQEEEGEAIMKVKNKYTERSLPHLIGSNAFLTDDRLGLQESSAEESEEEEDEEEEKSESEEEETESDEFSSDDQKEKPKQIIPNPKRQYSSSESDGDLFGDNDEDDEDIINEKPKRPDKLVNDLNKRLGKAPDVEEEKEAPRKRGKTFDDSGSEEGDLFGPSEDKGLFSGGGGLFDSEPGGGNLFGDEEPDTRPRAPSKDSSMSSKDSSKDVAKPPSRPKTNTFLDDDDEEENDLFAEPPEDKPPKQRFTASGAPFSSDSRKSQGAIVSELSKKMGIAARRVDSDEEDEVPKRDDNDLFDSFDDDMDTSKQDSLFSKPVGLFDSPSDSRDSRSPADSRDSRDSKPTPPATSLFDDDDGDLFAAPKPKAKSTTTSKLETKKEEPPATKKPSKPAISIFDDDEDDLFAEKPVRKDTGPKKRPSVLLFDENDDFGDLSSPPVSAAAKTPQFPKPQETKAPVKLSKSLFADDDEDDGGLFAEVEEDPRVDLFASPSKPATKTPATKKSEESKPKPKPATEDPFAAVKPPPVKETIAEEEDSDDGLFAPSKPPKQEIKAPAKESSDESDDLFASPAVSQGKPAAKPAANFLDDFDQDLPDMDLFAPPKSATPPKAKTAPKTTSATKITSSKSDKIAPPLLDDGDSDSDLFSAKKPTSQKSAKVESESKAENDKKSDIFSSPPKLPKSVLEAAVKNSFLPPKEMPRKSLSAESNDVGGRVGSPKKDDSSGVSFDEPPDVGTLQHLNKGRVKVGAKRRPPTRQGRRSMAYVSPTDVTDNDVIKTSPQNNTLDVQPPVNDRLSALPEQNNFDASPADDLFSSQKPSKVTPPSKNSDIFSSSAKSEPAAPDPFDELFASAESRNNDIFSAKPKSQKDDIFSKKNDADDIFDVRKSKKQPVANDDIFDVKSGKNDLAADDIFDVKNSKKAVAADDIFDVKSTKKDDEDDIFAIKVNKKKPKDDIFDTSLGDDDADIFASAPKRISPLNQAPLDDVTEDADDIFTTPPQEVKSGAKTKTKPPVDPFGAEDDNMEDIFASPKTEKPASTRPLPGLDDDESDIFAKASPKPKSSKSKSSKSKDSGNIFKDDGDIFGDKDNDDIFSTPKGSSSKKTTGAKKTKAKAKKKTQPVNPDAEGLNIFDDPLSALGN